MTVIVGVDGSAELDLGSGLKYVANIFAWDAELKRDILDQTTQADDFGRATAGLATWSGSFSTYLQFSDDTSVAQSSWQIFEYAISGVDDQLKAAIKLTLQREAPTDDYDIFDSTIAGEIRLTGTVVIGDIRLNCEDPEKPIVMVMTWSGDGPLTPRRG
jgi:hypothetical protein